MASTTAAEIHRFLGHVPQMREWGTGRLAKGLLSETYVVENMKYEATMEVDEDELEDDQTGQISIRTQELAQAAADHPANMIADLLINGEAAGFHSYDGVPFFSDAHVSGDSGAQSNKLDFDISAKMPAEPNTPNQASVLTMQQAFSDALAQMMTFKDDRGDVMNIGASGLVVICHATQYMNWLKAVTAALVDNTDNVIKQFKPDVIPMGRLTDASKFYLAKTDEPVRPFVFQKRKAVQFDAMDKANDEAVFMNGKLRYGVKARYRMVYGKWMYCVRVDFI